MVKGKGKKVVLSYGWRKSAIARAIIREGVGMVRINRILLDAIQPSHLRDFIKEPLFLAGELAKKVNIQVKVKGGGKMAQAEAVRLAIARGLVEWSKSEELRRKFLDYDRHLLIADTRVTEPHKPYRSAARRGRQISKR